MEAVLVRERDILVGSGEVMGRRGGELGVVAKESYWMELV